MARWVVGWVSDAFLKFSIIFVDDFFNAFLMDFGSLLGSIFELLGIKFRDRFLDRFLINFWSISDHLFDDF